MKIAIFGGSFNPIHKGHIGMINFLLKEFNFNKIIVIPIGIPSHKENKLVSGKDRMNMCKLAFEDNPLIEVSSIEIESNKISYTIDTLLEMKKKYPESEFYEIIGEDSAETFNLWKGFKKILKESKVLVFRRKSLEKIKKEKEKEKEKEKKDFIFVDAPYFSFSSTEIREKIEEKKTDEETLLEMLPQEVWDYIKDKKLYGGNHEV